MALELRPNCECCDKDLPPDATEARICTFECTFCANCVDTVLLNVCPNCGGGFAPRPIRPQPGNTMAFAPIHASSPMTSGRGGRVSLFERPSAVL